MNAQGIDLDLSRIIDSTRILMAANGESDFKITLGKRSDLWTECRGRLQCGNFRPDVRIDFKNVEYKKLSIHTSTENGSLITIGLPYGSKVVLAEHHCNPKNNHELVVCGRAHWFPIPPEVINYMYANHRSSMEELSSAKIVHLINISGHLLLRCDERFWSQCC